MSRIIVLFFLIAFSTSCNKSAYEDTKHPAPPYLRMWAMQACSTTFDINYNESPEDWSSRIRDTLDMKGFDIISYHLGFIEQEPFRGCGNCRKTGDYLDVEVPDNQKNDLKKLGFGDE